MEGAVFIRSNAAAAQRAHIKNLEFHYETSFLSELIPDADLSDRRVGGMLREVGMDRSSMIEFMRNFVTGSGYAAIDLTHVLSLSEGVISSTLGHNSSGKHYNGKRPHSSLGYMTPGEYRKSFKQAIRKEAVR